MSTGIWIFVAILVGCVGYFAMLNIKEKHYKKAKLEYYQKFESLLDYAATDEFIQEEFLKRASKLDKELAKFRLRLHAFCGQAASTAGNHDFSKQSLRILNEINDVEQLMCELEKYIRIVELKGRVE